MRKTLIRVLVVLVAGAAAAGAAVAYKQSKKSQHERAMLAELLTDLGVVEADDAGRAYMEGLARAAHDGAVERSFTSGGLTGGTYDVNAYQRTAVDWMIAQARTDGSGHIAEALEVFKTRSARLELVEPTDGTAETPRGDP
jgi:hypothetical protein